jgi:hypothetical protein
MNILCRLQDDKADPGRQGLTAFGSHKERIPRLRPSVIARKLFQ